MCLVSSFMIIPLEVIVSGIFFLLLWESYNYEN